MDSTVSDCDTTINLDDSDWKPPDNYSDEDSIEIVGEVGTTHIRLTRSAAVATQRRIDAAASSRCISDHGRSRTIAAPPEDKKKSSTPKSGKKLTKAQRKLAKQGKLRPFVARVLKSNWSTTSDSDSSSAASPQPQPGGKGDSFSKLKQQTNERNESKRKREEHSGDDSFLKLHLDKSPSTSSEAQFKRPTPAAKKCKGERKTGRNWFRPSCSHLTDVIGPPLGQEIHDKVLDAVKNAASKRSTHINKKDKRTIPQDEHGEFDMSSSSNVVSFDDSDIFIDLPDIDVPLRQSETEAKENALNQINLSRGQQTFASVKKKTKSENISGSSSSHTAVEKSFSKDVKIEKKPLASQNPPSTLEKTPSSSNSDRSDYQQMPNNILQNPHNIMSQPTSDSQQFLPHPHHPSNFPNQPPKILDQPPPNFYKQPPPNFPYQRMPNFFNQPGQNIPYGGPHNFPNLPPNFQHQPPNFQHQPPNFQHQPPNFQHQPPNFQHQPPNFQHHQSKFQNRPPSFPNQPPNFQNRPPNFQNRPPNFQNRPPNCQNKPPQFQNRPSGFKDDLSSVPLEPPGINTSPTPIPKPAPSSSQSAAASEPSEVGTTVVKSEPGTDLDMTSSSFELTPKKVPVKKRLSLLKRSLRVSAKGSITKLISKSPSAAKPLKTVRKAKAVDSDVEVTFDWDPANVISERQGVSEWQARQVISMFDQECTLPFIARYRREKTGNMEIDKLREVQNAYQQLKEVKQKVAKIIRDDPLKLPNETKMSLLTATTVQEVKTLTASLRTKGKRTLADRARQLGLTEAAESLLNDVNVAAERSWAKALVDPNKEGRTTLEEVETAVKHIIADIISKDPKMLAFMKTGLKKTDNMLIQSCQARKVKSQEKQAGKVKKASVVAKRKSLGGKKPVTKKACGDVNLSADVIAKYETYFNFQCSAWGARPHTVCAMNRGEQQGILSIKVVIPSFVYAQFTRYCSDRWLGHLTMGSQGFSVPYRRKLLLDMLPDCWDRLVMPSLQSWVRSELSDSAELASIEVFAANLRRLLLTPPVRANTVLAIDPGFHNGCKVAVVERKGKVLAVDTIYPFSRQGAAQEEAVQRLRQLVIEYRCEIVCIGNGTACRETESWLTKLVRQRTFDNLNVQYTIINESGASQYSVTPEAKEEFPDMDINHISAVSLARRLQDPLLEYVKVPAMHLGVGMYQHDVTSKLLSTSLDSVIMECVSFVGVDLNVASELVLRKVSGLNKARAAALVKHREECGPFRSREELKKVKGIGPVSFQQCAGFVRIVPQTLRQKSNNSNLTTLCPLDATTVHPESYSFANKLLSAASLKAADIGSPEFISSLKQFVQQQPLEELSSKLKCSEATLQVILESLYQPLDFDFRAQFQKPLFRKGVTSMEDLQVGETMTGSVRNVTSFGAFVDIGVGQDGLVHVSKMMGHVLQLGNTVLVKVLSVEPSRKRISLQVIEMVA